MMKILLSIILALPLTVMAAPEIKRVCTNVVDKNGQVIKNKNGTVRQTCKEIKVRKKVEGKEVPDGTKK
jgi:hypothetical protein